MDPRTEESKTALIQDLQSVRRAILQVASDLPDTKRTEVFLGEWSARELLAHLVGWDFTNLAAIEEVLQGKVPSFYAHHDRDWRSYNAQLVNRYGRDDFGELLSSVEDSHRMVIGRLNALPDSEIDQDHGVRVGRYRITIGRLLRAEVKDEGIHLSQLEAFASRERSG